MKNIMVMCDFDGTVTEEDIGEAILKRFGEPGWKQIDKEWADGKYGSDVCLRKQFALVRCTEEELFSFLKILKMDPFFSELVDLCREMEIPFNIISDGFDIYIKKMFELCGVKPDFVSNHAEIVGDEFRLEFPYYEKGCGRCANCKRHHIERFSKGADKIIYVGDGHSDRHAAEIADVVFAKDKLADYCRKKKVAFVPFADLKTVIEYLKGAESR